MTAWIAHFDPSTDPTAGNTAGNTVRVAVKDAIDVAGSVTTAGCAAVRARAVPATVDAACLAGIRAAERAETAVIVGKTTLTELCVSPVGDNPVFGTPVNPLARDRVPGGSSSGSAVAVAAGEADVALGTDTGGSVRIPAACCGVVGLKPTWGRIPAAGVWPLAPSLDAVGALARDVAGVVTGMRLLEPGWSVAARPAGTVGRLRFAGVEAVVEERVDAALSAAGLDVRDVELPGWDATFDAFYAIILGELWRAHHGLLDADGVGDFVNDGIRVGRSITDERLDEAYSARLAWRAELTAVLGKFDVLALPTLPTQPPTLDDYARHRLTELTAPVNVAGNPALSMPVPSPGLPVPVSLQLIGPMDGEDLLCATALAIESRLTRPGPAPTP